MRCKLKLLSMIIFKYLILFIVDGSVYVFMEMLFRGYSHISMFILGGICGIIIGGLNNWYSWDMSIIKQMFISGIIITILEYITGYIVNIKLKLNVWDYSNMPFNIDGQICLPFSIGWVFISLIGIVLDDWLRYILFDEEYKKYKII
jgi:uncharacterized membrane protein